MTTHRDAWVEIDLQQALRNLQAVGRAVGEARLCAVLKADGYGLGALALARIYEPYVHMYAVATLDEALELRRAFPSKDVLVLGYTPAEYYPLAIAEGVSLTMYDIQLGRRLQETAAGLGQRAKIHIKVETGMNRLGFAPTAQGIEEMAILAAQPNLEVAGIYTHFATADEADKTQTHRQAACFKKTVKALEDREIFIPLRHAANSPAVVDLPEYCYDMVRAGLILTGFYTSEHLNKARVPVKPCVTLKARLAQVKTVAAGQGVGYGHTFHTARDTLVGTVPLGFADGYSRCFSNRAYVICRGQPCPVIGNICMDQFMVDLSMAPQAAIGDAVILYGDGSDGALTAEDAADLRGSIVDEVLANLSKRLPRIYVGGEGMDGQDDRKREASLE